MIVTVFTNIQDAILNKTFRKVQSTMLRVRSEHLKSIENRRAEKLIEKKAKLEEDIQNLEDNYARLESATSDADRERIQQLINQKEKNLKGFEEHVTEYNESLINPYDLRFNSDELYEMRNGQDPNPNMTKVESSNTPEITTEVPETVQANETVASPVIDETVVTNENDETTYGVTPEETAESTNEIVQEEIPEPVNSDTINEDVAAPTDIIPDEPESQSMPSDDLSTMEDVFPDAQMQTEGATPEGSEDVASIPDESNPVEDILNQTDNSNNFSSDVFGVDTTSMAQSETPEIPEPVNFDTISEDVTAPTDIIPEEPEPQSMPSDDWSTMEDVFPDAQMQTEDATPVEPEPTQETSIIDEMFNPYYNNGNAETVTESEPVADEVPTDEPTEPVVSGIVEEIVPVEQPKEETTSPEVTETTQEDAGKQYEDELSKRLTFVYGDNYADEITKEENADRVQRIEEAVSNDIEIENKVNEELEDYKKHLLSEGFEEDSDDMLYLLGSKREIAEHELMYPDEKADLNALNENLLNAENERKIEIEKNEAKITSAKHFKENIEVTDEQPSEPENLDNELNADATLTVVDEETPDLEDTEIKDEEKNKDEIIATLTAELRESNEREKSNQEKIDNLARAVEELTGLVKTMIGSAQEQTAENENVSTMTR